MNNETGEKHSSRSIRGDSDSLSKGTEFAGHGFGPPIQADIQQKSKSTEDFCIDELAAIAATTDSFADDAVDGLREKPLLRKVDPETRFEVSQIIKLAAKTRRSIGPEGPHDFANLPIGIEVAHEPSRVYARKKGPSGNKFTWVYRTTVSCSYSPVAIIEFGAFGLHDGKWVLSNVGGRAFTQQQFADWYGCPNGVLMPGKSYCDPSNWSGSSSLKRSVSKWYFLGVDNRGERVKGEAVCEHLPKLE